jgi:hypothetical protein
MSDVKEEGLWVLIRENYRGSRNNRTQSTMESLRRTHLLVITVCSTLTPCPVLFQNHWRLKGPVRKLHRLNPYTWNVKGTIQGDTIVAGFGGIISCTRFSPNHIYRIVLALTLWECTSHCLLFLETVVQSSEVIYLRQHSKSGVESESNWWRFYPPTCVHNNCRFQYSGWHG